MRRLFAGVAFAAALAFPAAANDSSGFMGVGGLELTRSASIAMESEDLRISPTQVAVDYVFRNRGERAETTLVVFPLPDIDLRLFPEAANWGFPNRDSANFLDFSVQVDGAAVRPLLEQKAMVGARDVSDLLRRRGLGDFGRWFWGDDVAERIAALPAEARAELAAAGAIARRFDADWPMWRLQTRFYWEQTFPPGKAVAVAHRYRPFVGGALLGGSAFPSDRPLGRVGGATEGVAPATKRYCVDPGTAQAAAALGARLPGRTFASQEIEYILVTARNWSGPIGRFRLTIDKGSPDSVLSLCWRGELRKVGPTTFRFEATNWLPDEDIRLAIIFASPP